MTFFVGHHNALVGFFGWRIYFFHFPFMYIMGHVLTRDDLMKMIRFILLISIPMTALVVAQFYSPQSAWVNRGIGGDMEGAGFGGALGYFRPPGTFSFISGYVMYQSVVAAGLLYYVTMNNTLPDKYKFPQWLIYAMLVCYMISIPTSISRTHLFQTIAFLLFLGIASMRSDYMKSKFIRFVFFGALAIALLMATGWADTQLEAFSSRMESASKTEGGVAEGSIGHRFFGSFYRGLEGAFRRPAFGYGIGLGTNAGAKMMGGNMYAFGFNGEEEWSRVTGECGLIIGWAILFIRLFFSLNVWKEAYFYLTKAKDILPWLLACGVLLTIPNGQWAIPTNLGFCMLFGGFALAAINTYEEYENEEDEGENFIKK